MIDISDWKTEITQIEKENEVQLIIRATSVSNLLLIISTASLSIDTSTSPFGSGITILSSIIRVKDDFV
jgi:hypothetical protein